MRDDNKNPRKDEDYNHEDDRINAEYYSLMNRIKN